MKLKDEVYEILKWLSCVALHAIGLAYSQLANVWSLPFGDQISTTCDILGTLIGVLVGVSTYNYRKEQKQLAELRGE